MTTLAVKSQGVIVKFEPELLEQIVELARSGERTIQGQIRYLIKKGLERTDEK